MRSIKRFIASFLIVPFLMAMIPSVPAAEIPPMMPQPGAMVSLSPAFNPAVLKGVKVYANNPFKMDFILDKGDSASTPDQLKDESSRLVKYFLAALTTPEKDIWVNLSPYEKDRIVPDEFGQTDMGRDLLAQDYLLKQITSSVMYPEGEIGKKFWSKVYKTAFEKYGTTDIPVYTFNKVWIIPEYAKVYEHGDTAFVVKARLKVMLEQDYLALEKNVVGKSKQPSNEVNAISSEVIREIVIPQLEKEVNEGANFAPLRQVYYSLILSLWFKKRMKDSILGRKYMDQNKVTGIDIDDKDAKQKIYEQYVQAFKKGVYNYIKEENDPLTNEVIPRKYFSGGFTASAAQSVVDYSQEITQTEVSATENFSQLAVNFDNAEKSRSTDHGASTDSAPPANNVINIAKVERQDTKFVGYFRDSWHYIAGWSAIVPRYVASNTNGVFLFETLRGDGSKQLHHVIWNYTKSGAPFGAKIPADLWTKWLSNEGIIEEASKILVESLKKVLDFYSWKYPPTGIIVNDLGNFSLEAGALWESTSVLRIQ